jgi:hypothetical protein
LKEIGLSTAVHLVPWRWSRTSDRRPPPTKSLWENGSREPNGALASCQQRIAQNQAFRRRVERCQIHRPRGAVFEQFPIGPHLEDELPIAVVLADPRKGGRELLQAPMIIKPMIINMTLGQFCGPNVRLRPGHHQPLFQTLNRAFGRVVRGQ